MSPEVERFESSDRNTKRPTLLQEVPVSFREVREVVRRWQAQQSLREVARETGLDRKTVRRYFGALEESVWVATSRSTTRWCTRSPRACRSVRCPSRAPSVWCPHHAQARR